MWAAKAASVIYARESHSLCGGETCELAVLLVKKGLLDAAGCIMGELLHHAPLFPGRTEIAMLDMFTELLGSPHEVYKVLSSHCV